MKEEDFETEQNVLMTHPYEFNLEGRFAYATTEINRGRYLQVKRNY